MEYYYASCVWDKQTQYNTTNKLEMVQRRAAQFITADFRRTSSITAILANLQWNTLQQNRMQLQDSDAIQNLIVPQLIVIPATPFLIPGRSSRGPWFHSQLSMHTYLYSFFLSAICKWNKLSPSTVSAPSLDTFKDQLPLITMYM